MTENQNTPFLTKCEILAQLWLDYRYDEEFTDFVEYADLGLPLAYAIANGIVGRTELADKFVDETFDLLLGAMDVTDTGFASLDDIFENSSTGE